MFGLGMQELVVILVIMLVIFGPGKIPQIGAALGQTINSFKKSLTEPKAISSPEGKKED